ncbi:hypothetical protein [Mesoflavibacter zeaxanthinifaciens]|jgi:inorganic pyrophosphatase/exopolyphosphatase|uniref:hypothetical protein n=1 Tax=Mesoflavibacter zeaxanthinifaciens TaxID=393060 RepID=UPI003A91A804
MKQIAIFFIFLLLVSCQYFEAKKTSKDAILKKELKTFNWNEVDTYPSFPVCDSLDTLTNKKQCFETTLANHISTQLAKETFVVTQDINDTIILEFLISEKGQLQIEKFTVDSLTITELPNIQQIIESSLDSLPPIYAALKRGQQVKTQFKLPIILQVN